MAATEDHQAGTIILNDLALFNKAYVYYVTQIDSLIRTEVGRAVETWLEQNEDWTGGTDASESFEYVWVAPLEWCASTEQDQEDKKEEPDAFAWVRFGPRSESDSYEVADLFGVGTTDYGFHFEVEKSSFGGIARWNAYAKTLAKLGEELRAKKWTYQGKGSFFQPVRLAADRLADAWNNEDWSEAMVPLLDALDALKKDKGSLDTFTAIIAGAKEKTA